MTLQMPPRPSRPSVDHVIAQLTAMFGNRASTNPATLDQHSHGEGLHVAGLPDIVIFPQSDAEVASILSVCNAHRVPVVPFGAGSSLEGQLAALAGGVSINMAHFDKIIEVSAEAMDCRVGAGVTREALNTHLRDLGMFFPVDPGANATIGGMASTRASGTNAVKYGTMRENVLGLTVVTPDGRILRTGSRARKSAAGLDLTHLYVGSEGTLGVIIEIQLKLHPIPESIVAATCAFPTVASAVDTTVAALQAGLKPARIELLDDMQIKACNFYSMLTLPEVPHLFMEFVGAPTSTTDEVAAMEVLAAEHGCQRFEIARSPEDRNRLWKARHNAYHATVAYFAGKRNMGTDACVPISELSRCLLDTKADVDQSGLTATMAGHVGDGNFHIGIMYDPADAAELEQAEALAFRISRRAIAHGGTCSGEHGIGTHKIVHMETEHGAGVDIMKDIKSALDPNGIMNPGKIYPR